VTHRLAIVASHVIQYQDPFFRRLAKEADIDLTVVYCSDAGASSYHDADMNTTLRWDIDLLQGYRHVTLRNFGFGSGYTRLINPGIVPSIALNDYDAVIFMTGWGSISALLGIVACRMSQKPFFLYGDSSFPPAETTLQAKIRAFFIRTIFRLAAGFMYSGVLNAEYYRHYGGSPDSFFLLPWAIDNDRFEEASRLSENQRRSMRREYGIGNESTVFVFSAKLVERKDPMTLLRAFERMNYRRDAAVLFLGDGELRARMQDFVRSRGLSERVHFAGFVNQTDLPAHYGISDVFILPSLYEPRGAVVNEAMACGLPVIVTDRCGSIGDIVQPGENALIFGAGDDAALASHMDLLTINGSLRRRMAQRSREIIRSWSYSTGVEGVKAMLERVCQQQ